MRFFLISISLLAWSCSAFANPQSVITDANGTEWLITHEKGASLESILTALNNKHRTGGYDQSKFKIIKKGCSTEFLRMEEIYDACIIDKLPSGAKSTLRHSVINVCDRISCNPNFYEKLKY